jgi:hypothetical protein
MTKLMYAAKPGGKLEVEVTMRAGWKETAVSFNGTPLGVIDTRKELEEGREFDLPEGGHLTIHLPKGIMRLPRVVLNGQPMHLYSQPPEQRLRGAFQAVLVIGIFNVGLGAIAALTNAAIIQRQGGGPINIAYGAVFLALAFFVRRGSFWALAAAVTLFVLDSLALLYFLHAKGQQISLIVLLVRAGLLFFMIRGFSAIRYLRGARNETEEPSHLAMDQEIARTELHDEQSEEGGSVEALPKRRATAVERLFRHLAWHGLFALAVAVGYLVLLRGLEPGIILLFGLPPTFAALFTSARYSPATRRIAWSFLGAVGLGALVAPLPTFFPNLRGFAGQLGPWQDRMLTWYVAVYLIWLAGVLPVYAFVGNLRAHWKGQPARLSRPTCYLGLLAAALLWVGMTRVLVGLGFWPVI